MKTIKFAVLVAAFAVVVALLQTGCIMPLPPQYGYGPEPAPQCYNYGPYVPPPVYYQANVHVGYGGNCGEYGIRQFPPPVNPNHWGGIPNGVHQGGYPGGQQHGWGGQQHGGYHQGPGPHGGGHNHH